MALTYRTDDWSNYKMVYKEPHRSIEPPAQESAAVDGALAMLVQAGILPTGDYDEGRFLAFRQGVRETFEIPWTAITPRMQRLLWAISAIARPQRMVAAGIFCGNTFISNAGAAVGPGAVYAATDLVGVEIDPERAALAERNVRALDPSGTARIVAADAIDFVRDYDGTIDLLYLDADGRPEQGKGVYLDILQAAWLRLADGAIILAHNSVNCAERLTHYLNHVRDKSNCRASVNMILDGEGLEVSQK